MVARIADRDAWDVEGRAGAELPETRWRHDQVSINMRARTPDRQGPAA